MRSKTFAMFRIAYYHIIHTGFELCSLHTMQMYSLSHYLIELPIVQIFFYTKLKAKNSIYFQDDNWTIFSIGSVCISLKITFLKKHTHYNHICFSQQSATFCTIFQYSFLNLSTFPPLCSYFLHWDHEYGSWTVIYLCIYFYYGLVWFPQAQTKDHAYTHTPITPSAQNPRFDSIKAPYRSNRSCHCRRQSSFNAQQNASLPKGPCYYTQQPPSSAE